MISLIHHGLPVRENRVRSWWNLPRRMVETLGKFRPTWDVFFSPINCCCWFFVDSPSTTYLHGGLEHLGEPRPVLYCPFQQASLIRPIYLLGYPSYPIGLFLEYIDVTLWLFNIAMDNCPFIDDFPIKTSIYSGFSMAMLNNQRVLERNRSVWSTG